MMMMMMMMTPILLILAVTATSTSAAVSACYKWSSDGHACECCKSGRRGDNCTIICPNCRSKYFNSKCHHHCMPGFCDVDSSPCSKPCSATCTLGYDKAPVCHPTTGECSSCQNGNYGTECQHACRTSCVKGLCDKITGHCLHCANTTCGDYCDQDCSSSCKDKLCDRLNRFCMTGCIPGRYGSRCLYKCNKNCKGSKCILTVYGNPVCADGCIDTFTGRYCDEKCPVNCLRCDQSGGACTACEDGFEGVSCSRRISETNLPDFDVITVIIPVTMFVIITLVVAFFINRRKVHQSKTMVTSNRDFKPIPVSDWNASSKTVSSLKTVFVSSDASDREESLEQRT